MADDSLPMEPAAAVAVAGPWRHRDVHANGMRFHVVEAGDGPLVLLVHGFPTYWWTWRQTIVALADAGYRAVAIDLRGYGGSDHPPRGYDAITLARDLAGIIRSLGEPGAVVVGHGTGGLIGWTTAALIPQVVHRLVAVSSPHPLRLRHALTHDRDQRAAMRYIFGFQRPLIPERQLTAHDAQRVDAFLHKWSGNNHWPSPDVSRHFRAAFRIPNTAHCALEFDRWALRSLPRPDGRRFANSLRRARVTAPVLQVHGAADTNILIGSALGSSEYVDAPYAWRAVDGVGHFPQEETPGAFNGTLLAWLESTPPWADEPTSQESD